jgi:Ca2+:H+ antiporter
MKQGWGNIARLALPVVTPLAALALLLSGLDVAEFAYPANWLLPILAIALIMATVFAVLHHAEAVAHRVGEPYGTLVLTFAVTGIEASVITSLMLHGANNPTLARESVFSTVMIVCAGVVGLCLTIGGLRHREQQFRQYGTNAYLSVLIALAMLTLVLPDFTLTTAPGTFSASQLALVSVLSVMLYGGFVFVQTGRHKGDFLEALADEPTQEEVATDKVPVSLNAFLMMAGLIGIVVLTENIAGSVEAGLEAMHIQQADSVMGAFIALLVLSPEAFSAIKAAARNQVQRSLNIALGSACATIGLTVPVISVASLITGREVVLGLKEGDTVMLVLVLLLSILSFATGRTTVLTGLVHLVVFVAYVFLIFVP